MARPVVTDTTEELYAALGPWMEADGEDTGWALLAFAAAPGEMLDETEVLVRDQGTAPGWSQLVDLSRVPDDDIAYLGQYVGVDGSDLSPAVIRDRIVSGAGHNRGTPSALVNAASELLTGSKHVVLIERDGSPYRLTVRIYTSEAPLGITVSTYDLLEAEDATYPVLEAEYPTYDDMTASTSPQPDPAQVERALLARKPGGLVLNFVPASGATYDELEADFATYIDLETTFPTYDAMTHYVP